MRGIISLTLDTWTDTSMCYEPASNETFDTRYCIFLTSEITSFWLKHSLIIPILCRNRHAETDGKYRTQFDNFLSSIRFYKVVRSHVGRQTDRHQTLKRKHRLMLPPIRGGA